MSNATTKKLSRPQKWAAAVSAALKAKELVEVGATELESALTELLDLQCEYQEWRDGLPANLEGSVVAERLDEVCAIDLSSVSEGALDDWTGTCDVIDECEIVELPRGFGRD